VPDELADFACRRLSTIAGGRLPRIRTMTGSSQPPSTAAPK
jgi:hypothetical protein